MHFAICASVEALSWVASAASVADSEAPMLVWLPIAPEATKVQVVPPIVRLVAAVGFETKVQVPCAGLPVMLLNCYGGSPGKEMMNMYEKACDPC